MIALHQEILEAIKSRSGKGTQHTLLDSYLGTSHPRYAITAPVLRKLAGEWMNAHKSVNNAQLAALITSLVEGKSATEKVFAGMLLDCASRDQGAFDPQLFDRWLEHLEGWAEIDSLCTGKFTIRQIIPNWAKWKPLIKKFAKSSDIHKRRASLVLLCSPLSHSDNEDVAQLALDNISKLKQEKDVLITRGISWLLRSMIKHQKPLIEKFVNENAESLPKIAVRETKVKLATGTKTKRKTS